MVKLNPLLSKTVQSINTSQYSDYDWKVDMGDFKLQGIYVNL